MEDWLESFAAFSALALEGIVVLTVLIGGGETCVRVIVRFARGKACTRSRREIWMRFASWILLSLEFALGADIIRTAIAPTWDDIGKLGAIAAIRTGLGFFLERDIEEIGAPSRDSGGPES